VQQLRAQLRNRDLEIGRIEAGALSAWDRMVPQLQQQIDDLLAENDTLRRGIREAEEHSDVDAATVDHLRELVAERDTKIAELRAQI
jgi:chromosome segregation ATPase